MILNHIRRVWCVIPSFGRPMTTSSEFSREGFKEDSKTSEQNVSANIALTV